MKNHNNFKDNLANAQKAERAFGKILEEQLELEVLGYNNNYKHDILAKNKKNTKLLFEVKEDDRCNDTGNVVVEYESWGRPSGIRTTKAHFQVFRAWYDDKPNYLLFTTQKLKQMIKDGMYWDKRKMSTTDSGNRLYFFKFEIMRDNADRIYYD